MAGPLEPTWLRMVMMLIVIATVTISFTMAIAMLLRTGLIGAGMPAEWRQLGSKAGNVVDRVLERVGRTGFKRS